MTNEQVEPSPSISAAGMDETAAERASDIRQFVIFVCDSEVFAVDMTPVQEIIRVPEVVRVPLAPSTLEGLANLRGKVLPIISLRRLFGFAEQDDDDATRALVIDLGQPLGFVVDRVSSVVGVEPGRIEGVDALAATVKTELLSGILKDVGGYPMVMVLDFERLIRTEFAAIAALSQTGRGASFGEIASHDAEEDAVTDELQLVSFEVAEQEYAILIENVQEIVQFPDQIVHVPRAEAHVLGVMTLRNRLLPLVSLRCLFELPAQAADERSRIVVVRLGEMSVGLAMDSVNEVLRVPKSAVDAMPKLLARHGDLADIADICRLDDGQRLVSIISTDNLFRHSSIQEALTSVAAMRDDERLDDDQDGEAQADDEEQVVVFRLDKEEFGVPIESVQEIVRIPDELTHVPKAPSFVEGVINLRGAVLPVIDQRRRLGLATVERNDRQRIMVFLLDGVRTGFIVDSVAEVLKIPKSAIEPSPRLSLEQTRLIGRVANLERQHRMIQLIEPAHLVAEEQREQLAALSHATPHG
ncbi:chemotaxis protein CheW [Thiocystis violascens]|uniref:Chemotaxis protein CheW n=1 Tax=Thiocystis violascens (strain ATCC 17096 / DSM 198 / 6111) TaxID=765911 RepID=I3Y5X3_THIV6|nr:chemotaxis protein CheW [Thiocystis violascens]AFL72391.1 chemotaxis signal transduction protein [Thiocystis violascens DSM 198]